MDENQNDLFSEENKYQIKPMDLKKTCESCFNQFHPIKGFWERRCNTCRINNEPYRKKITNTLKDEPF